jgi:glycosyltransferase involved in cell wall biosynthesis
MKISIVTISYNQANYLEECIQSVLSQDYADLEYIIVDPGSTDGSRDIIEKYRDQIAHIIYEKDEGPADGLNKGFAKATGDIFYYLNSDDILLPGAVSDAVNVFNKNLTIDIIYGHGYIVDSKGTKFRKCFSDRFSLKSAAYGAAVIIQPSTFFKSICFAKAGGFNKNNKSNWDGELFIDFILAGCKAVRVNKFFSYYRVYDESITGSGSHSNLHNNHSINMFKKIMNRNPVFIDKLIGVFFRIYKHITHPVIFLERILKGPIFKSGK